MSKKRIFYVIFFTVLVVGFFVTLSFVVPGYVHPKIPPIGEVHPFAFTSQEGKTITEKDVEGKVSIANFFFTTCRSVCPIMNNNLVPVYQKFKDNPDFVMLSYTSDPERDSVARLKHYADSMKVDPSKWIFLTGAKDSLYRMARESYRIDDTKNYVSGSDDDFIHTQFIALVNKKGEVVQIYDGIKPSEVRQMENQIQNLLKE